MNVVQRLSCVGTTGAPRSVLASRTKRSGPFSFNFDNSFSNRHLLTLPSGFRVARGTEQAVITALETPIELPRVLIVPQWCVDPVDSHLAGELSSLDLEELRRQTADGTARLCLEQDNTNAATFFGAQMIRTAVDEAADGGVPGVLRGADTRHSGEGRWRTRNGLALLRSDAVSPAIVVDLWSAPALFLRHIEVWCLEGVFVCCCRALLGEGFVFCGIECDISGTVYP